MPRCSLPVCGRHLSRRQVPGRAQSCQASRAAGRHCQRSWRPKHVQRWSLIPADREVAAGARLVYLLHDQRLHSVACRPCQFGGDPRHDPRHAGENLDAHRGSAMGWERRERGQSAPCCDQRTLCVHAYALLLHRSVGAPATSAAWPQFVFALTRGEDGLVGGRLWRSDDYGKSNWDDRTNEMEGAQLAAFASCNGPACSARMTWCCSSQCDWCPVVVLQMSWKASQRSWWA